MRSEKYKQKLLDNGILSNNKTETHAMLVTLISADNKHSTVLGWTKPEYYLQNAK